MEKKEDEDEDELRLKWKWMGISGKGCLLNNICFTALSADVVAIQQHQQGKVLVTRPTSFSQMNS